MVGIRPCVPNVVECEHGPWLATTPKDHPYRIGVFGRTEAEARRRFDCAFAAWEELHERALVQADPGRASDDNERTDG